MENVSKYQDINKQLTPDEIEWIMNYFKAFNNPKRISYNEEQSLFYWFLGEPFTRKDRIIPDENMEVAYRELYKTEQKENRINSWREEYGEVIAYFHNNAFIDDKGIFLKDGFLSRKKYFTRYELDELKKRYKELQNL